METVEIYYNLERIAIHKRSFDKFSCTTVLNHMPPSHQAYKRGRELNAEDYLKRALMIGPEAKWAVSKLINGPILPQYAYRNCRSFFCFADKHGSQRVERACALIHAQTEAFTFQLLKNIIEKDMDKANISGTTDIISTTPYNDNVRGASSYTKIESSYEHTRTIDLFIILSQGMSEEYKAISIPASERPNLILPWPNWRMRKDATEITKRLKCI